MKSPVSKDGSQNIANFNRIRGVSILFLLTIIGFIVYLIITSSSFPYDGKAINIAGRQRMLSQKIAMNVGYIGERNITVKEAAFLEDLEKATKVFGATLNGFKNGGLTKDAGAGGDVMLKKVQNPELQKVLSEAEGIWTDLEADLLALQKDGPKMTGIELATLKDRLAIEAPLLLKLMNDLTVGLEGDSAKKNRNLFVALIATLVFTLIYYFYIVAYSLVKLKAGEERLNAYAASVSQSNSSLEKSNMELSNTRDILEVSLRDSDEKSKELAQIAKDLNRLKEESDKIFSSVDHGLCLLTPKLKIGSRVSDAMYKIFEKEKLVGFSFIDLIRPLISEKDLNTLKSYLALQFDGKTLAKQLEKYNPLKNVEMNMNWDGNNFSNKFVGFDFERISNDGKVEQVLVTITDITDRVILQRNLEESEAEQRLQTEILSELLKIDGASFRRVIAQAERSVDEINEILKSENVESGKSVENRNEIIDPIFRKIHNIKGNSSVVGLNKLANVAHSVESELDSLRAQKNINGDAILGALVQLSEMRELISEYQDTRDEFQSAFQTLPSKVLVKEEDKINHELSQFAEGICKSLGKKVHIRTLLDLKGLPDAKVSHIKEIYSQLIRNSLAHGIESSQERRKVGKLEEGFIFLSTERVEDQGEKKMIFRFRDDGRGLDLAKIKEAALAKGLLEPGDSQLNDPQALVKLIFKPGFSTADTTTDVAGRGTGMDVVRNTIVNELDGKMSLSYSKGNYTEITWEIPSEFPSELLPA